MESRQSVRKDEMVQQLIEKNTQLRGQLEKSSSVDENVELLVKIIDIFVWGQKNDWFFSDFFIEQNIMAYFLTLLHQNAAAKNSRENMVALIKAYSFFLSNIKDIEITNYVFSHANFNPFLTFQFDFKDDEVVFYFVNFVKSLSQRFECFPFQIFYNKVDSLEEPRLSSVHDHSALL